MRVLYPYHLCYSSDWKFCCAAEHYKHAVTVLCHTTNVKGPGCIFHSMAADTALGEDHCSCPSCPCAVLSTALLEGSQENLHTFLAYLSFFYLRHKHGQAAWGTALWGLRGREKFVQGWLLPGNTGWKSSWTYFYSGFAFCKWEGIELSFSWQWWFLRCENLIILLVEMMGVSFIHRMVLKGSWMFLLAPVSGV